MTQPTVSDRQRDQVWECQGTKKLMIPFSSQNHTILVTVIQLSEWAVFYVPCDTAEYKQSSTTR